MSVPISAIPYVAPSTSGNVLTSNGTIWTSAAAGGGGVWSLIGTVTQASDAATLGLASIATGYNMIRITGFFKQTAAGTDTLLMRFNDDSGFKYGKQTLSANSTTVAGARSAEDANSSINLGLVSASNFDTLTMTIQNNASGDKKTGGSTISSGVTQITHTSFHWDNTASEINKIEFSFQYGVGTSNILTGSKIIIEGTTQ